MKIRVNVHKLRCVVRTVESFEQLQEQLRRLLPNYRSWEVWYWPFGEKVKMASEEGFEVFRAMRCAEVFVDLRGDCNGAESDWFVDEAMARRVAAAFDAVVQAFLESQFWAGRHSLGVVKDLASRLSWQSTAKRNRLKRTEYTMLYITSAHLSSLRGMLARLFMEKKTARFKLIPPEEVNAIERFNRSVLLSDFVEKNYLDMLLVEKKLFSFEVNKQLCMISFEGSTRSQLFQTTWFEVLNHSALIANFRNMLENNLPSFNSVTRAAPDKEGKYQIKPDESDPTQNKLRFKFKVKLLSHDTQVLEKFLTGSVPSTGEGGLKEYIKIFTFNPKTFMTVQSDIFTCYAQIN